MTTQAQIATSNQIADVSGRLRHRGFIAMAYPPHLSGADTLTDQGKKFVESCGCKVRGDALLTVQKMTPAERRRVLDASYRI